MGQVLKRPLKRISIVTPIHNESENIPELVQRIAQTMNRWCAERPGMSWEHLACDDWSTDGSFELLQQLSATYPDLRPLKNVVRSGQTGGFQTGFQHASGDVIVTMDADLQNFPEDIPVLLEPLETGRLDLANAIRSRRQHAGSLIAISKLGNWLIRFFMTCPVADAASNFTALPATLVKDLRLQENDHRYTIPILVRRGLNPKRIGDVITRHAARKHGASKYKALRKALTGFPELLRCCKRLRAGYYDFLPGNEGCRAGLSSAPNAQPATAGLNPNSSTL